MELPDHMPEGMKKAVDMAMQKAIERLRPGDDAERQMEVVKEELAKVLPPELVKFDVLSIDAKRAAEDKEYLPEFFSGLLARDLDKDLENLLRSTSDPSRDGAAEYGHSQMEMADKSFMDDDVEVINAFTMGEAMSTDGSQSGPIMAFKLLNKDALKRQIELQGTDEAKAFEAIQWDEKDIHYRFLVIPYKNIAIDMVMSLAELLFCPTLLMQLGALINSHDCEGEH